ncbi:hypothetical protein WJX81_005681 [Elliptochloris bilobata]|uniref:Ribosome biogenesis protein NOP53 n=1 Tax=Elliptochloris bilobata TaxID=381761 RepID=A0AAW1RBB1_9CHLO
MSKERERFTKQKETPPAKKVKSASQLRRKQLRLETRLAAAGGAPLPAAAALQAQLSNGGSGPRDIEAAAKTAPSALRHGKRLRSAGEAQTGGTVEAGVGKAAAKAAERRRKGGPTAAVGVPAHPEALSPEEEAARKELKAQKKAAKRAAAGNVDLDSLGGVPKDPEKRAAWLARVAEMAAARGPNDKPLPKPMRVALKQKQREDKRAANIQWAEGRPKLSREAWERRRAMALGIAAVEPAAQLAWLAEHQAECDGAGGPRVADLAGCAEEVMVRVPPGPGLKARLAEAVPELLPALGGLGHPLPPGSPAALLVAPGAIRAQELKRQLKGLAQGKPIFKAFAKHLKLERQQEMLAAEPNAMVAGTPHRLAMLCLMGTLRLDRLRLLVLDVGVDAKQLSMMDMLDVRRDFFQLWAHVGPAVADGRARIGRGAVI